MRNKHIGKDSWRNICAICVKNIRTIHIYAKMKIKIMCLKISRLTLTQKRMIQSLKRSRFTAQAI